jgi:hypothetical protein
VLALSATTLAITPLNSAIFSATGGTAPYTFSVTPGGVGGTINSSGFYTAPNSTGTDIVVVTDSLSVTASLTILVGNALELFCDVIQNQMGLAQGRVYLWDQKIDMPKDDGLFIPIQVLSCKSFGNQNNYYNGSSYQSTNFQALLSIDIMSRGPSARDQKELVIMALNSFYAQSQQQQNGFYIAQLSSGFTNLSVQDGAAILYRFNITVQIMYAVSQVTSVPYYDTFTKELYENP